MQAGNASISSVTEAVAFFTAARGFNAGVQVLAAKDGVELARSLLAAQALECVLKSYLSHAGVSESTLRRSIGHNLEELWRKAVAEGAPIQEQPSAWCKSLNELHDSPYRLRYPMGLHGLVLPGINPMVSELQVIVSSVEALVQPR